MTHFFVCNIVNSINNNHMQPTSYQSRKRTHLSIFTLIASGLSLSAVTDEAPKTEGTANPDPLAVIASDKALLSTIKYPEGMKAQIFAREPFVMDPTAITFDEQNRLYIAETHRFDRGIEDNRRNPWVADDYQLTSTAERLEMYKKYEKNKPLSHFTKYSEKIRVIEDRDADGKADFYQIYAEEFNHPLDGTAAGVMALDGKVYLACIPNVWMLEDTDGDLKADKRESLQEGYGISVSLSGHDLNGFALGPDNRIWFTIGDRAYNLKTKDGRHLYSQYEGAVFRMERDGSGLEVMHTGLRNPKEIAFDRYGNLFSVDNEADMQDMARVVNVVEGAHSGWQRGHQAFQKFTNLIYGTRRHDTNWMRERHWDMDSPLRPRAILAPAGWVSKGPSGLAYNPGSGLAEKWDNHFFVCDFVGPTSAVIGFRMEPKGAGFQVANKENFVSGFLNTDIEFGYDCKAYVTDYVGSWPTHGFGNIFTFEDPKELAKPETKQVKELFAKGFGKLTADELTPLLRHPDMRVRLRAQLKLAEDTANLNVFIAATKASESLTTRLHGVWGIGNLARLKKDAESVKQLITLCSNPESKLRGQAAQALGDSHAKSAADTLVSLLADSDPRTQMLAAIALGKVGDESHVATLMALIEKNNDQDEYLRHGAVQGMVKIGNPDAIFSFAENKSPAVRRAIVLSLRRLNDGRIGHFLKDSDLSIAVEAVQAINDAYIEDARKDLAASTHLIGKSTWAIDLRILNAMIRAGGDENAKRLIEVAKESKYSADARTEALFLLGRFEKAPPTDPTTGMYRPIPNQAKIGDKVRQEIHDALFPLLAETSGETLVEALKLADGFKVKIPTDTLISQLNDDKNLIGVRLSAMKKLETEKVKQFNEMLVKLCSDKDSAMRANSLQTLARLDPESAFKETQNILKSGSPSDQQLAIDLLASLNHPQSESVLLGLLTKIKDQPVSNQLNIILSAEKKASAELKKALANYEKTLDKSDPLAAFAVTLEGGNLENGRKIFFQDGAANCAQCHKVGDRGGEAGPNLLGVGGRHDTKYLLESIIAPSAALTPGYTMIAVTMKDGALVSGLLMENTDSTVVVRNPETKKDTICKKEDIANLPPSMSPMPPMGAILPKDKIRDLITFLSSLKK